MKIMRILLIGLLVTSLSGCLSNISTDGLISTGASTVGAVLGTALTGDPLTGLVVGATAGVAADAVTESAKLDPVNYQGEDGVWQFTELLAFMWVNFTQHLIGIAVALGLIWIITGYLGLRTKRPEERNAEKQITMLIDKIGKMKE